MTEPGDELYEHMRGVVTAALTAQLDPGLADHPAGDAGVVEILSLADPLDQAAKDLLAHLVVHALRIAEQAIRGWSRASGHDVSTLLDVLRHYPDD